MNLRTQVEPGYRYDQLDDPDLVDPGILSRMVLGPSGSRRLDMQLDLMASSWLGVLIGVVADPRAGLLFIAAAFVLTACSSRMASGRQALEDHSPRPPASSPSRS